MITPEKIEEWLREVEERPFSALLIIRFIANRLNELSKWNEELLADNIALRTERKVEEYERQIGSLEYQVELLKRQLGGEALALQSNALPSTVVDTISVLLYTPQGQVQRVELKPAELTPGQVIASFTGEVAPGDAPLRLLAVSTQEELLFVFDTGRTVTMPVTAIPLAAAQALDWQKAYLQVPLGSEELATILPIARMSLAESCIQVSRKGFVKKIKEAQLETYIAKSYVGAGVKQPLDRTCSLTLCAKEDRLVMVSKEGFALTLEMAQIPITIEEAIRLSITDHIVASFSVGTKPSLLVVTRNGKAIHRAANWLEVATSLKTHGQPIFSQGRRDTGVRVVGAAPVSDQDWSVALRSDGKLTAHKVSDLFGTGSLLPAESAEAILGFVAI